MEKFSLADALRMLNDDTESNSDSEDNDLLSDDEVKAGQPMYGEMNYTDLENSSLLEKVTSNGSEDKSPNKISPFTTDINSNVILNLDDSYNENPGQLEVPNEYPGQVEIGNENPGQMEVPNENEGHLEADRGRKRYKDAENWKQSIRKRKRQTGQDYISSRGKQMRSRELKTIKDCAGKCRFQCAHKFSKTDRENIFKYFWTLNDSEKNAFYANTSDKDIKQRSRTNNESSRRKCSIKYFFEKNTERVRVCKTFYLTTLDISQRRIQYFYDKSNQLSPLRDLRGKRSKSTISAETYNLIKTHIDSFPRVESHYCRASSSKEYLEKGLSLSKMYTMYLDWCKESGSTPARKSAYRKVFKKDFNIGFFIPKKDRCDLCSEIDMANNFEKEIPNILKTKYHSHREDKEFTKKERDLDRANDEQIVICFDMQNVIMCPRSNVSNFFYKRKLNVYNLTAHCSKDKTCYNVVWNEAQFGRGSNEIASAVTLVLEKVIEKFPATTTITLWSDSCVPQNKNSIMCLALKKFLATHANLNYIIHKFGTPGHSAIQEVDNIHSHIEKRLKVSDIFSPLSFIRTLKSVRPTYMEVIQMQPENVFDFQSVSNTLQFREVPFSKLKCIKLSLNMPFHVEYLLSFPERLYQEVSILRNTRSMNADRLFSKVPLLNKPIVLSSDKRKDLESMLKFLPPDDIVYLENLCKIGRCRPTDK